MLLQFQALRLTIKSPNVGKDGVVSDKPFDNMGEETFTPFGGVCVSTKVVVDVNEVAMWVLPGMAVKR